MKTEWLRRLGGDEVVVFFHGWGMDRRSVPSLAGAAGGMVPGGGSCDVLRGADERLPDLLLCFGYHSLDIEPEVLGVLAGYRSLRVVAWSFGVWVARQVALPAVSGAVALNGTLYPVDAVRGIRPDVFAVTLAGWSVEARRRFYRRMCGSPDVEAVFLRVAPEREVVDQQEELAALQVALERPAVATWMYDYAVVGRGDLIFSAAAQERGWQGLCRTVVVDMPHYPFCRFGNL